MADYDSSLPIRTQTDGDAVVKIAGSTIANIWDIDANGIGMVNLNDGTNSLVISGSGGIAISIPAGEKIIITDGTDDLAINNDGSINVDGSVQIDDGTDTLAINTDGSINSIITDGTDTLDINTDGSINVNVVQSTQGDEVHEYATTSGGVPGTPNTVIDYTVTAGHTLLLKAYYAACSGKFKAEVQTGTAASEVTRHTMFGSTSSGDKWIEFPQPLEVVAGDKVLVIVTNNDKANADVYAAINGFEI